MQGMDNIKYIFAMVFGNIQFFQLLMADCLSNCSLMQGRGRKW